MTLFWGSSVDFLQVVLGEKMVVLTLKAPLEAVNDDDLTFAIKYSTKNSLILACLIKRLLWHLGLWVLNKLLLVLTVKPTFESKSN